MKPICFFQVIKSRLGFFLVALLPFLSTGCLVFEKQTLHMAYSPKDDTINAILIYHGLDVGDKLEVDLENAKQELKQLTTTNDLIYVGHPLLRFSFQEAKQRKNGNPQTEFLDQLMIEHVTLSRGVLFQTKEGQLCYSQHIKIRQASQLIKGLNKLISMDIIRNTKESKTDLKDLPEWEKDVRERVLAAAKKGHPWLQLKPGRISVTSPANREALVEIKSDMLQMNRIENLKKKIQAIRNKKQDDPGLSSLGSFVEILNLLGTFLIENDWSLDQRKDKVTLSFGVGGDEPIPLVIPVVDVPPPSGDLQKQLVGYSRKIGATWDNEATVAGLLMEFRKKHFSEEK